jgi:predicted enzyme related to lactoylglutathione lyase
MNFPASMPPLWRRTGIFLGLAALTWAAGTGWAGEPPPPPLPPLTTVPGSPRLPGKFVWADLVTHDVAGARRFYGRLFNWTFRDAGGYTIAANDERPLCGMFQRAPVAGRPEGKPRWFGYISVRDVEKAGRIVTKAGGRVLAPPQKLPKRGEQAIFADPEGAVFGVIRASSGDPPDFMAEPGDWVWIQRLSRDAKQAAEFYRKVGRYDVIENGSGKGASDYVLSSDGYARATVRTIPSGHEQVQPSWLPFVRVKNLGESLALTTQLGGAVRLAPKPELFDGKVAVVSDPTGAAIGLMEWSDASLGGGR